MSITKLKNEKIFQLDHFSKIKAPVPAAFAFRKRSALLRQKIQCFVRTFVFQNKANALNMIWVRRFFAVLFLVHALVGCLQNRIH